MPAGAARARTNAPASDRCRAYWAWLHWLLPESSREGRAANGRVVRADCAAYCGAVERAYAAVVVGSGFGGGVAACRLAERGWRVCVLERGRRFGRGDFPDRPEQAPRVVWHPRANPGGMFDLRLMRDVAVLCAAGVGGGSLVYANVQLRAPAEAFEQDWPEAIDRPEL